MPSPLSREEAMSPVAAFEGDVLQDQAMGDLDDAVNGRGRFRARDAVGGDSEADEEEEEEMEEGARPRARRRTVSCMEWAAYHIHTRAEHSKHLVWCQKLLQEFVIDMYCQAENHRTRWIRHNQGTLRSERYRSVMEAADGAAMDHANAVRAAAEGVAKWDLRVVGNVGFGESVN